jgi:hypothetical protein
MESVKQLIAILVIIIFIIGIWLVTQRAVASEQPIESQITQHGLRYTNQDSTNNTLKQSLIYAGTERSSLNDLRGVCLKVVLSSPAPVYGLTKQALQRNIESLLHTYGINVFPGQQYKASLDVVLLKVNVDWRVIKSLRVVYASCNAQVLQVALLPRSKKLFYTYAITWDARSGTAIKLENLNEIHNNINDVIDKFIKDFLAANQRESLLSKEEVNNDN